MSSAAAKIQGMATSIAIDVQRSHRCCGIDFEATSTADGVLIRYNEDGAQDHLFANTGVVVTNPVSAFSSPTAVRHRLRTDASCCSATTSILDSFETVSVVARYLDGRRTRYFFRSFGTWIESNRRTLQASAMLIDSANRFAHRRRGPPLTPTFTIERLDTAGLLDDVLRSGRHRNGARFTSVVLAVQICNGTAMAISLSPTTDSMRVIGGISF